MKNITTIELNKSPWYKEWFDSQYYHLLYKDRNEDEAAEFIDHLHYTLNPSENSKMIDVGCGAGRHCKQLAKYGYEVFGIDLSIQSIRQAKNFEKPSLRFFQHDMRKNFGNSYFDYVFNFFTSFGYFKDQDEHDLVMGNMASALKPGGKLVIDYLNINKAERNLKSSDKKEIDGVEYYIYRWMSRSHFHKQIIIENDLNGSRQEHIEKVARFSLCDFKNMFAACGLKLEKVYGDYQMNAFDLQESPRLIMIAGKK